MGIRIKIGTKSRINMKRMTRMRKYVFLTAIWILINAVPVTAAGFVDNDNGSVTDTETGLMWQQSTASARTWENAISYCESLSLAGYSDWRLPDRNELQSLVDYTRYHPAIDETFFPDTESSYYWSSTTYAPNTDYAWGVNFYNGYVGSDDKSNTGYVRAVRGGQ